MMPGVTKNGHAMVVLLTPVTMAGESKRINYVFMVKVLVKGVQPVKVGARPGERG